MTAAWSLAVGEVTEVLSDFRDASFDALLCDPPYGFSFMGKSWDYDVPSVELWAECLRVLKPGAPLVAFGGSRTYHRLACGIEDAGFELFDCLMWLYAKAMPKPATTTDKYIDTALKVERPVIGQRRLTGTARIKGGGGYTVEGAENNYETNEIRDQIVVTGPGSPQAKKWEGYGHALKPGFEPIVLACKPFDGTIAHNVLTHDVGGLDLAGCQLPRKTSDNPRRINEGCWPANVVLTHAEDCVDGSCVSECPIRQLDEHSGIRPSRPFPSNVAEGNVLPFVARSAGGLSDTGGASRFFFCGKVNRTERDAGCEALPMKTAAQATGRKEGSAGSNRPQAGAGRGSGCRNIHPTLKPISLTTWLARLICPPKPGVVLVPFAGAGSEMIGCLKAGWSGVFGIEREAEYAEIARARLRHWCPESEAA